MSEGDAGDPIRFPSIAPTTLHAFAGSTLVHGGLVFVLALVAVNPPSIPTSSALITAFVEPVDEMSGAIVLPAATGANDPFARVFESSGGETTDSDATPERLVEIPIDFEDVDFDSATESATESEPRMTGAEELASASDSGDGESSGTSGDGEGDGNTATAESAEETKPSVEFFGIQGRGQKIVFVVDCSRSMMGEKWERVREELIRSLERLSPEQSFYVIFFDGNSHPMFSPGPPAKEMLAADSANLSRVRRWIMSVQLGANTSPLSSMVHALKLSPDATFLLTDGEFADSTAQWLRDHNRIKRVDAKPRVKTPVHTVGIFNTKTQRLLKRIARENAGQFQFVPEHAR